MILLGVIHKVLTLGGGKGGSTKNVLDRIAGGGRGSSSFKPMYAMISFRRLKPQRQYQDSPWSFELTFSNSLVQ